MHRILYVLICSDILTNLTELDEGQSQATALLP